MAVYTHDSTTVPTDLNGGINASVLTINVTDGSSYPAADFLILINAEIADIQSRTGNVLTVRTGGRGYGSTIAASHVDTDEVTHVIDAEDLPFRKTVGASSHVATTELIIDVEGSGLQLHGTTDTWLGFHPAGAASPHSTIGHTDDDLVIQVTTAGRNLELNAADGDIFFRSNQAGATAGNFYVYVDDSAGSQKQRIQLPGDGDSVFNSNDGSDILRLTNDQLKIGTTTAATVALPDITKNGDEDTGILFNAADQIGIVAGGVELMRFNEGSVDHIKAHVPIYAAQGTLSNVSISRGSATEDVNTGILFTSSADRFSLVAGGVELLHLRESTYDYVQALGHAFGIPVKTTAGTGSLPTDEGMMLVNTTDRALYLRANGSYRTIATW